MINRVINKFNNIFFKFDPSPKGSDLIIQHIGTIYGGYDICVNNLENPVIISCGLGEDASFDIEMINKYNAKVISVDPTPRALEYYKKIKKRFGEYGGGKYDESGRLDVSEYNLLNVNENNFAYIDKAIWSENDKELKLYYPKNLNFVSLSINNKKNYDEKNFFLSKTISYQEILSQKGLKKIDILKLDIEGAEIQVIKSLFNNVKLLPDQLIVEYDLRRRPTLKNYIILKTIHSKLTNYYQLIFVNSKGDFTYIKNKLISLSG